MQRSPLPAIAMEALPQDVLGTGGNPEGFLYFEDFETTGSLTLRFELRTQAGNELLGMIDVPLVITSEAATSSGSVH